MTMRCERCFSLASLITCAPACNRRMQVLSTAPSSPQVRALLGLPHHVLQKIVDAAFDRLRDDTRMIELDEFQRVFADAHDAHAQVCDEIDGIY